MLRIRNLFLLFIASISLSGCLGLRLLEEDQQLLYRQNMKGNKSLSTDELEEFYRQKPNKRIPIFQVSLYVHLYNWGEKRYDVEKYELKKQNIEEKYDAKIEAQKDNPRKVTKFERKKKKKTSEIDNTIEEGNLLMQWGEPLAVYDSNLRHETTDQLSTYLKTNGYFEGKIESSVEIEDKLVFVNYYVREGIPHVLDSIVYNSENSEIDSLIEANNSDPYLVEGDNYNQNNLVKERERIETLLQDNGYYAFSRQYIRYIVDTTKRDHKANVVMSIRKPFGINKHKKYIIDSVIFTTDAGINPSNTKRFHEVYNGITYKYLTDNYNNKILDRRVFIYPGQLYSKNNTLETQRQLANLDNFKFINIIFDSTENHFIANIFASPLKKYQTTNEVGLTVTEGFPGPFYNLTLKTRNIFGGLENFEITGRVGYEGVASASDPTKIYGSSQIGGFLNLTFPQFLLPLNSDQRKRLGPFNPKTRLVSGLNFTNRPEYTRSSLNSALSYLWQRRLEKLYNLTLGKIRLINSKNISSGFRKELDNLKEQGNNLYRTFEPSFVMASSYGVTFNFNKYGSIESQNASFLRLFGESGGTLLNIFDINFLKDEGLEMFKYVKIRVDYRRYSPVSRRSKLAFRINIGAAKAYSDNKVLPYEEYFFSGGSNSIRGWAPRRLGPGSYYPTDSLGNYNNSFEQPGELLFETNLELRTKVVGFINTAFFLDVGNVWMFAEDPARPGAKFELNNFLPEIAIGSGFGLRFDFNFLLLRLDFGLKLYNPGLPPGERFVWENSGLNDGLIRPDQWIINLGIGYPF